MRKSFCIITTLTFAFIYSYAQKHNNCTLSGTVVDASTKKLLANVTVSIESEGLKKNIISSDIGAFKFIELTSNKEYQLKVLALGYREYSLRIKLFSGQNEFIISLIDTTATLNNVEVKSTANKVSYEPGKVIFKISEEDIKNSTSASSLLNKVPYISISASGDVKIKGHIPAQIYLDGKAVNNTILKSLPINDIDKVEVTSNPSGNIGDEKDDGIINIITKKKWDGYFGTMGLGIGTNENYSPSFSFSTKGKKLETNFFFSLNHYNNNFNSTADWYSTGSTTNYTQNSIGKNKGLIPYFNLGLNYNLDSLSTISYLFWISPTKYSNLRNSEYDIINEGNRLLDYYLNSNGENRYVTLTNSLDFVRKIRNSKNSYSLSAKYYRYLGKGTVDQQQTDTINNELHTLQNNKETIDEYSLQFNYNLKSIKKIAFTMGAKYINRNNKSSFSQSVFDSLSDNFIPDNSLNAGNNFKGTQNIFGAYVTAAKKIKKLSLSAGLRYEYTHDDNNYYNKNLKRHYGSFIPSITGTLELSKKSTLNFSYSKRIYRPGIVYLNPYINSLDPRNLLQGNTNLQAEKRDKYEIDYVYSNKSFFFSVGPYLYNMGNQITTITSVYNKDTLINTYNNIGKNRTAGISVSNSFSILKKIKVNSGVGIERNSLSGDTLSNNGSNFYFNTSITVPFKVLLFEGSYQYSSAPINIQGKDPEISSINLSLSKKIKDKLLIQISAADFLSSNFHRTYVISTNEINRVQKNNMYSTIYMIRLNYSFGKSKNKTYINSKINNSDLKN